MPGNVIFGALRAAGALPLPVLAAILRPVAFARTVGETLLRPGRHGTFRVRMDSWLNLVSLFWADRFTTSTWRRRIDVGEIEQLRRLLEQQPVIVVTLHFGGIFQLAPLLRASGIPTAGVVGTARWPPTYWRRRRAELTRIGDQPLHFAAGDARAVVRYLKPGRCLMLAADYPHGEQAQITYGALHLRLSTPPVRLAQITGAAVIPVLVLTDGFWRYRLHVGEPVPPKLVSEGRFDDAMAHVAGELLPITTARPEHALRLLEVALGPGAAA